MAIDMKINVSDLWLRTAAVLILGISPLLHGQSGPSWPFAGQNLSNTRFAPSETQLSPATVSGLGVKWIFTTGGDVSATPSVDASANVLYVPDWSGHLYKIDAGTGLPVWTHVMADYGLPAYAISRTTPALSGNTIVIGTGSSAWNQSSGAYLLALDTTTGDLIWKVQPDPSAYAMLTSSPIVYNGVVYMGVSSEEESLARPTFRGSIQAYSLATGTRLWQTYTVPSGSTGGAVWSSTPVVDTVRGSLYITTGNNYTVPEGVADCEQANLSHPAEIVECQPDEDHFDSVLALDLSTGTIKWSRRMQPDDAWNGSCSIAAPACPNPAGPDYDFGAGANLFTTVVNGTATDIVGAGQKSGVYWALNPDNGDIIWQRPVGPGGSTGGIEWGAATDGQQIYVAISNTNRSPYFLNPSGMKWNGGSWAALAAPTGAIKWQVPDQGKSTVQPRQPALDLGPVTVANGVVYAPSMSGFVYALDAASGATLWSYDTGASVNAGAAVVNGTVYWGSGYNRSGLGTPGHLLFAFSLTH